MHSADNIAKTRWPTLLNAAVLLFVSFIGMAALSLRAKADIDIVAVVFPPWWDTRQVFLAASSANAAIVRSTSIPSILVVQPNGHDGLARLRDAGVWLVLDPKAIAACFTESAKRNLRMTSQNGDLNRLR